MNTRMLECPLDRDQLLQRGQALSECLQMIKGIKDEKKQMNNQFKKRMEKIEITARLLASEIRTQHERRAVEISTVKDYMRKCEETIRLDTGEVIDTRALTLQELQLEFDKPDARVLEMKLEKLDPEVAEELVKHFERKVEGENK